MQTRLFVTLALLTLSSGAAFAHAHLKSAMPAVDGTVSVAPTHLDLTFSEGLNLAFTGATVTGPGKAAVPLGQPALQGRDTTLVIPVGAPLAAGTYTVDWHALSTDGHKTTGRYTFAITP